MWLYGVGLYSIAFPLSIVNIFITFVPFKVSQYSEDSDHYKTLLEDQQRSIQIYHDFEYLNDSLRQKLMMYSNIVPAVFLFLDMVMSKIRYPATMTVLGYLHILMWLMITYVG